MGGAGEEPASGQTGGDSRGVRRSRRASGLSSADARGKATAIQIQPMSSDGGELREPSIPSTPPSANGESPQSGVAPPSDGRTCRQAGARDARISISTASSRPARSVTLRTHFTPPLEARTPDTEPAGWAVNATRKSPDSGGRVQADSRTPLGRTCLTSVATASSGLYQCMVSVPGRQSGSNCSGDRRDEGASSAPPGAVGFLEGLAKRGICFPASPSSATEKHGATA